MHGLPQDPPLNPYEAPQTRELPVAALAETAAATTSLVSPPREVQRWMNAAIILYFVSFAVPYAPWFWQTEQDWHWGVGTVLCLFGVFFFWHPFMISWWANVMFWIAYRYLNRVTSGKALGFAIAGMALAPIIGILEWLDPNWQDNQKVERFFPTPLFTSAPYLCWLGSMLLMLIAAIKLRRVVKASETPSAARRG